MKTKINNLQVLLALMILSALGLIQFATAQSTGASQKTTEPTNNVKTESRMLYHNGPVMSGAADVYFIWYGCWDDTCIGGDTTTQSILTDFASSLGGSPYLQMNSMYPGSFGGFAPSGALFYAGAVFDRYSHGNVLTASDMQGIVNAQIESGALPQDPVGIYVVLASADVSSNATGFCIPGAQPHHGLATTLGVASKYAFVGNPRRCPSVAAPQFVSGTTLLPTPNGSFAADAMATTFAHLMNVIVTNPNGTAWYDRYGLENADKCLGQFGPTYTTANGARANIKFGQRDYLIQQNWVNDRRGHCAMNSSL